MQITALGEQFNISFLRHYDHVLYISCIIHDWRDIQVKGKLMTVCQQSIIGCTCPCVCDCEGLRQGPIKQACRYRSTPSTAAFGKWTINWSLSKFLVHFRRHKGNHFEIVTMDRCLNLKKVATTSMTTMSQIQSWFMEILFNPNGISRYILMYNSTNFVRTFFETLWEFSWRRDQTRERVEWFNKTLVLRLRHWFLGYQQAWDISV